MTHRLVTDYAKNYCNRALILKVIVENVVTCFLLGHSVVRLKMTSEGRVCLGLADVKSYGVPYFGRSDAESVSTR